MIVADEERMRAVIARARDVCALCPRWRAAVERAAAQLDSNPFIHWNGRELLILSSSNEIYVATAARGGQGCQCEAYRRLKPCWHRAAARLIERYHEAS